LNIRINSDVSAPAEGPRGGRPAWLLPVLLSVAVLGATAIGFHVMIGSFRSENRRVRREMQSGELAHEIIGHLVQPVAETVGDMARHPALVAAARGDLPPDAPGARLTLTTARDLKRSTIAYVMNTEGAVVACSPYGGGETLTGNNYRFRPYFTEALAGRTVVYPAVGVTTNRRGIYVSHPLYGSADGLPVGVLVFKLDPTEIDRILASHPEPVCLVSPDGIVFSSNRPDWLMKAATPIPPGQLNALRRSRQFADHRLTALATPLDAPRVSLDSKTYNTIEAPFELPGGWTWRIVMLQDPATPAPLNLAQKEAVAGSAAMAMLLLGVILLKSRWHCILERRVRRRTCELNRFNERLQNEVSARRATEYQLRNSRQRMAEIFDFLPDATFVVDAEGVVIAWNRAMADLTGVPAADVLGKGDGVYAEAFYGHHRPVLIDAALHPEATPEGHYDTWNRDGDTLFSEVDLPDFRPGGISLWIKARPLRDTEGRTIGAVETIRDITDRKRSERQIAHLARLPKECPNPVMRFDDAGRLLYGNIPSRLLLDAWGCPDDGELPETWRRHVNRALETGRSHVAEFAFDGRTFTLAIVPMTDEGYVNVYGMEITDRIKLQEELMRSQKLESIGQLAGGIAHDFNNLLTGITGNLSMIAMTVPEDDRRLHQRLSAADKAAQMAQELAQRFLTFAKGGLPIRENASLKHTIVETVEMTQHGSAIRFDVDAPDDLWAVEIDRTQIHQALHNLVTNAAEAMGGSGVLTVEAANVDLDADGVPLPAGRYVTVRIADTGCGIRSTDLARIFDPYFTTKTFGSGLGLTTCDSVIRKHGGHIHVESEPGQGTAFTVYLPAAESSDTAEPDSDEPARGEIVRGSGRVLLMDDEGLVRQVAGETLQELGYEVDYAVDGDEAVALYRHARSEGRPFDLVIVDLTVPGGRGGLEAMEELKRDDPTIRAIVSTGYSRDPVIVNHRDFGFVGVLLKPYRMEEFSQTVAQAMRRSA
jgi:PAS domain S-box-containing protein